MGWTPVVGECCICGKEILLTSAKSKYCPECREEQKKRASEEHRAVVKAKRIAVRRGTDPDRYKGKETECKYKGSCFYGSGKYCEYLTIEGHSRLLAGYPIRGGKCGAYKRGKKKVKKKIRLPEPGGWNFGDLSEV